MPAEQAAAPGRTAAAGPGGTTGEDRLRGRLLPGVEGSGALPLLAGGGAGHGAARLQSADAGKPSGVRRGRDNPRLHEAAADSRPDAAARRADAGGGDGRDVAADVGRGRVDTRHSGRRPPAAARDEKRRLVHPQRGGRRRRHALRRGGPLLAPRGNQRQRPPVRYFLLTDGRGEMHKRQILQSKHIKDMAEYQGSAVARDLRNSVGDQTFCRWRQKRIVKQKAQTSPKNTAAQLRQQARWSKAAELETVFAEASAIGFPGRKKVLTPANAFMKANVNESAIGVTGETKEGMQVTVNYENIVCATGKIRLPDSVSVVYDEEANALSFTVVAEGKGAQRLESDRLYALVVETAKMDSVLSEVCERGEGGMATVTLKAGWAKENLKVYVFMVAADGKKASDSRFMELG